MRLEFTKMHGLGNDFLMLDLVSQRARLDAPLIRRLADRHTGVGFDQLLIVEAPTRPDVDFRYRIFNADGSEVSQCGNGARCFARFVRDRRLTRKDQLLVETSSGVIKLNITRNGWVTVDMGSPRLMPKDIPFLAPDMAVDYDLALPDRTLRIAAVSMGNPHAVLRVESVASAAVAELGPLIEAHRCFPERVNAGFMEVVHRGLIRLRVYERGAGETLACGTGACAAVVAGIRWGVLDPEVRVALPGGELTIAWAGGESPVLMTGPTARAYDGVLRMGEGDA
ncbi:MAG: diaminopimelate epimerase [Paraperlucidibaca sp.]